MKEDGYYWSKDSNALVSFVLVRGGRVYSLTRKSEWVESHILADVFYYQPVGLFPLIEKLTMSPDAVDQFFGMVLCKSL